MVIKAKSFVAWMKANFEPGQLEDLAQHGADAGWGGLTYYTDTVALYDKFSDEIWAALNEDADSFGAKTVLELIAGFGGAKHVSDDSTFKNLLVWYMAERVANALVEGEGRSL